MQMASERAWRRHARLGNNGIVLFSEQARPFQVVRNKSGKRGRTNGWMIHVMYGVGPLIRTTSHSHTHKRKPTTRRVPWKPTTTTTTTNSVRSNQQSSFVLLVAAILLARALGSILPTLLGRPTNNPQTTTTTTTRVWRNREVWWFAAGGIPPSIAHHFRLEPSSLQLLRTWINTSSPGSIKDFRVVCLFAIHGYSPEDTDTGLVVLVVGPYRSLLGNTHESRPCG